MHKAPYSKPWGDRAGRIEAVTIQGAEFNIFEGDHADMVAILGRMDFSKCQNFFNDRHWNGGLSEAQTRRLIVDGDDSLVPRAEALMGELDLDVESARFHPQPRPIGFAPRVGAFLAGDPCDMWGRERDADAGGPIRLYVSLTSSAGIGNQDLQTRGIAAIALAMALARIRPVEVFAYCGLCGDGATQGAVFYKVSTSPLDLGRVCAWFGQCATTRSVVYQQVCNLHGSEFQTYHNWASVPEAQVCAWHAERAGCAHAMIPGPFMDTIRKITADPRAWCEKQLKLALAGAGEGHEDNLAKCKANH